MSKLYDTLLVPEWRTALSPKGFADAVLQGMRAFTGRIAAIIGLTPRHTISRPYHRTLVVPLSEIAYVNMPACNELTAGDGIIAGSPAPAEVWLKYPYTCAKWRMPYQDSGIDIFGAGFSSATAIRGRDFYYHDGCYWFNKHPSTYGTVSISGNQEVLTVLCAGGDNTVTTDPFGLPYRGSVNSAVRDAVNSAVYGNAPLGISRNILHAVSGCCLTTKPVKMTWREGDLDLALDIEGNLNYAPKTSGIVFRAGQPPVLTNVVNNLSEFMLSLPDHTYVIQIGNNNVEDFPEVSFRFPDGVVNGTFNGAALLQQLQAEGCVFYQWNYIDNDQSRQQSLVTYNIGTGKAVASIVATVGADVLGLRASAISTESAPATPWFNTATSCYNYI